MKTEMVHFLLLSLPSFLFCFRFSCFFLLPVEQSVAPSFVRSVSFPFPPSSFFQSFTLFFHSFVFSSSTERKRNRRGSSIINSIEYSLSASLFILLLGSFFFSSLFSFRLFCSSLSFFFHSSPFRLPVENAIGEGSSTIINSMGYFLRCSMRLDFINLFLILSN